MASRSLILRNGKVLNALAHAAEEKDVLIADGVIAEIGPPGIAAPVDAEIVDVTDRLLIPGLVNAHSHGHGSLCKGMGDRWSLELLLNAGPWMNGGRELEDKYLSALLNGIELVRRGCTAVYDLYAEFPVPTVEGIDAVARGYRDAGIRAVIAPMIADRSLFEAIPHLAESLPAPYRAQLEKVRLAPAEATLGACRQIARGWSFDRAQIRLAIAPTIPLHCSDGFIRQSKALAEEFGLGVHMHLAELRVQAVSGVRRYGKTLTAHLDDVGLLTPNFTGAHCVWLDNDDISRLADRGCKVAHNPGSNMRLGSGIAPAKKLLDRGVTVGIGTDGVQCSDHQNMFEAMRLASFASRIVSADVEQWIGTETAFAMATSGSASVLGFGDRSGRIAAGALADITFIDLADVGFVPLNDVTNQLVHSADTSAVASVMVAGRFLLRDREFVDLDYGRLRGQVSDVVTRLMSVNADRRKFAEGLSAHIAGFCVGLAGEPYHVSRWMAESKQERPHPIQI